jgi:hypothetical protein
MKKVNKIMCSFLIMLVLLNPIAGFAMSPETKRERDLTFYLCEAMIMTLSGDDDLELLSNRVYSEGGNSCYPYYCEALRTVCAKLAACMAKDMIRREDLWFGFLKTLNDVPINAFSRIVLKTRGVVKTFSPAVIATYKSRVTERRRDPSGLFRAFVSSVLIVGPYVISYVVSWFF